MNGKTISAALLCGVISGQSYGVTTEFTDYSTFSNSVSNLSITNFDDFNSGSVLQGNEFSDFFISSRNISVINPQDFSPGLIVGGVNVNSQPNGISASLKYNNVNNIVFDNLDDNFEFVLVQEASAAGLWLGNLGASNNDPFTATNVSFFDSAGSLIASESLTQATSGLLGSGANNRVFYGITSDINIASFIVQNASFDSDGIMLDDVQVAMVPEASQFTMFTLGLFGLWLYQRKRSRKHHA